MASAFMHMANAVATAFTTPKVSETLRQDETTTRNGLTPSSSQGVSPGWRIDLQAKLLTQVDILHKMYERGATTPNQFEQRRESLLKQLDHLDEP